MEVGQRGLRLRASKYDRAGAGGQFARGIGERTPTSGGRADIPRCVQWQDGTPSAVRQTVESYRLRGHTHHHEAGQDSAKSHSGSTVTRDAK